jgi:cellulose synthase/poly-beta-1,6-N-acetylglucosamine synthase-like glycosyltransferase
MIIETIFWIAILLVLHSYVFYPLLLGVLAAGRKNNPLVFDREGPLPFVSVVIAAFNEEAHIGRKITSVYDSSYPPDFFEVLVGSDGSSDRTVESARMLAGRFHSLQVHDFEERRGKGNVVNDLVQASRGDILILTDANVYFDRDTIFHLVKHFRNPDIGLVDSNMINRGMKAEGISYQEKAYISREVRIKNREGRLMGAMMGPFGGCYAIRREDYEQVPPNYLVDDFYINMKIFEKGKKAINDLEARVYEEVPDRLLVEFRRKVRIGTGNFQNLRTFWRLLFTRRYGFAFLSHKVLRWLGPMFLLAAFTLNIALAFDQKAYQLVLAAQVLFYLIPLADLLFKAAGIHVKTLRLGTHFISMNAALFIGFFRSCRSVRTGIWERTARA